MKVFMSLLINIRNPIFSIKFVCEFVDKQGDTVLSNFNRLKNSHFPLFNNPRNPRFEFFGIFFRAKNVTTLFGSELFYNGKYF